MLSYKPKFLTKKLLSSLNNRASEIVSSRYGLNDDTDRKTLESIGQKYGITRERVRQIENAALATIRKSENFKSQNNAFEELGQVINNLGSFISEEDLLKALSSDECIQNHIHLYLVLGDQFIKSKEDDYFKPRWTIDRDVASKIEEALKNVYANLSEEEIIPESEIIARLADNLKNISEDLKKEENLRRWISVCKIIDCNPLGEWGRHDSSNVDVKGIRDYSFLVMKRHGSPMHFREVAKMIEEIFSREAHVATCHNELIKDPRFVLVGRGVYALAEWGYTPGVVREVITSILKKEGPLSKEDVIDRVMKERYLKKNTILVNLQNSKNFKKTRNGLYTIA